jgi:hypothetical protein
MNHTSLLSTVVTLIFLMGQWANAQTEQPPVGNQVFPDGALPLAKKIHEIEEKMGKVLIPSVEFKNAKLIDALKSLEQLSVANDPKGIGVKIIFPDRLKELSDTSITFRRINYPLSEVIRELIQLVPLKYEITGDGIVLARLDDVGPMVTNQYTVPPNFLSPPSNHAEDPFTPNPSTPPLARRLTALDVLENAGITFAGGATAIYHPATSTLIAKNTQDQMDLIEAYIESIKPGIEKQIHLKPIVIFTREPLIESNKPAAEKKEPNEGISQWFKNSEEMMKFLYGDEIQKKVEWQKQVDEHRKTNGFEDFVFTDPQLQIFIKSVTEKEGTQIKSLRDVCVQSGTSAVIAGEKVALGVQAVLGADNHTLDLYLHPRFYNNPVDFDKSKRVSKTTWDGQTVLISGKLDKNTYVSIGVKALIVDAAGRPIHSEPPQPGPPPPPFSLPIPIPPLKTK